MLKPVLEGDWWRIGPKPDLSGLLPDPPDGEAKHECVDHHIVRDVDGVLHLWSCIRHTPVGRVLGHWRATGFTDSPWEFTRELIRCDHDAGECIDDWHGQEWLQSPFFVWHEGACYMFYGGHSTGAPEPMVGQICLMTSPDGRSWTRRRDERGFSRLFTGPGETRDPCVRNFDGVWHLYYAGFHDGERSKAGFYCRTSEDLLHWSDWRCVHLDPAYGSGPVDCECPHVVRRGGRFYLLRTENYYDANTHVFVSDDPMDFGVGDASGHHLCDLAVAAPEIHVDADGSEYVSSNHEPVGGTQVCRLRWVE